MVEVSCQNCNANFKVKPHWLTIGKGKFCSRTCSSKANIGKKRTTTWTTVRLYVHAVITRNIRIWR